MVNRSAAQRLAREAGTVTITIAAGKAAKTVSIRVR
jgi:hypothetical protein